MPQMGFDKMKSPPLDEIMEIDKLHATFESTNKSSFLPSVILPMPQFGGIGILEDFHAQENMQLSLLSNQCETFENVSNPIGFVHNQTSFTHTFLKSILTAMESKDPVVANAWLETLIDVIDLLPRDMVKDEVLSLALNKGQSSELTSRLTACKLIGKISTKFEPYILQNEVLGIVQSLCHDEFGEVRESICSQLASVARGVGPETTQRSILPELVRLCSDEEVNVRLAGINTAVQLIPLLDRETRMTILVPTVKLVCENAVKLQDLTLPIAAHLLGRICHGLHDDLNDELKEWFISFFCTLSKLGLSDIKKPEFNQLTTPDPVAMWSGEFEAECRKQCAYNMPAMIIFAGGASSYRKYLHDTLVSLVTDPNLSVRHTIALCFHQICNLIGNEVKTLRELFLNLLRSGNLEIISAIAPNISNILATFHHHQVLNQISQPSDQTNVLELVGALKQAEGSVCGSKNWRVHSEVLRQMAALALCLPPDLLFSEVVPLMIARMHSVRPIPCRLASARTLLVYLHHMESLDQRDHICNTLVIEFCEGKSCHKRMLYLNVCKIAIDLLPETLFKEHFYQPLLSLHVDPVANIRLNVVKLLPFLKSSLMLPEDGSKLEQLESAVGNLLLSETDRDVTVAISDVIHQLDRIELYENERRSPEGQEFDTQAPMKSFCNAQDGKETGSTTSTLNAPPLKSVVKSNVRTKSKVPSIVAAERRKSTTFPPEVPPDEKSVLHLDTLDTSADDFMIDAGIRMDKSSFGSRTSPIVSCMKLPSPATKHNFQSRLRQPSVISKIPVVGRDNENTSVHSTTAKGIIKSRVRIPQRQPRPMSGVSQQPQIPVGSQMRGSRGKSLSHENLHSSSSRLILTSNSASAKTSPASSRPCSPGVVGRGHHSLMDVDSTGMRRVHQHQHQLPIVRSRVNKISTSCSSSPSGSRCASPDDDDIIEGRNYRPSSPERDKLHQRNKKCSPSNNYVVSARNNRPNSAIPTMVSSQRNRSSKLPLPTSKNYRN